MVELDQILPFPLPPTTGFSAGHCTDGAAWRSGEMPVWKASGSVGPPPNPLRRRGNASGEEPKRSPLPGIQPTHVPQALRAGLVASAAWRSEEMPVWKASGSVGPPPNPLRRRGNASGEKPKRSPLPGIQPTHVSLTLRAGLVASSAWRSGEMPAKQLSPFEGG